MLYEILKTSKLGASFAPDMYTALWAQKLARDGEVKTLSGAPPLSFQANGTPLLDYLISGNTVQSGTPTPDSPIMPQGTGERTGNLWCASTTETSTQSGITIKTTAQSSEFLISKSVTTQDTSKIINCDIKLPAGTYTVAIFGGLINYHSENEDRIALHDGSSYFQNNILVGEPKTFTLSESKTITRVLVVCKSNSEYSDTLVRICIVQGSTPPSSYIPYGYKIPISSASTTTPIYLGEVESTRRIKKYVFTGEENGTIYSTGTSRKGIEITGITGIIGGNADIAILAICTHYQPNTRNALYRNIDNGISNAYQNDRIIFYDASCQTVESFQQFCTQQYAAGTPVCVWYVLANEETAVVNEPLMRIGDYADTVSMAQAGVEIPTERGTNTLDVLTDVKPSEVYIKYKGV